MSTVYTGAGSGAAYTGIQVNKPFGTNVIAQNRLGQASQNPTQIGNLLAGDFGSLTRPDKTGIITASNTPIEKNRDRDHLKDSDEMLKIANNLDMKDMWAAA